MAAIKEQSIMSAKKNDLMTFNFRTMKFEPCTHDPQKADNAKANYWETLSEDQPQVQEIVKAFNALRSAKDNLRKLIDGSTKKEVGVDVLKKKNILLIISCFSKDDISKLNSIYESEATPKEDNYKIVWIIMVEQISAWTDEVLDMLTRSIKTQRSKKAWYVLPCFSQAASDSQFMSMSKEWQFKNELIMMVMDIKGKDKVTNIAFRLNITPTAEMNASVSTNPDEKAQKHRQHTEKSSVIVSSEGPQKRNYEFYYRGTNDAWNATFLAKANKVGQDVLMVQLGISVKSFWVSSQKEIKEAKRRLKAVNDHSIFSTDTSVSLVVLIEEDKVLKSGPGDKMLGVLERFDEQWKKEVEKKGFARSFMDSYENSS